MGRESSHGIRAFEPTTLVLKARALPFAGIRFARAGNRIVAP